MTHRRIKSHSESITDKRLRYTHRSSVYVPRNPDGGSMATKEPVPAVVPPVLPYAAEVSVLEAARLARENLPSAAPSPKHKTVGPQSSGNSAEGLVSDLAR